MSHFHWHYKLGGADGHQPVKCSLEDWAEMLHSPTRRVAWTQVDSDESVSTVFLGIDHNFSLYGPPLLFETMIFGGEQDQYQERYATWDEAVEGHQRAVCLAMGVEYLPQWRGEDSA